MAPRLPDFREREVESNPYPLLLLQTPGPSKYNFASDEAAGGDGGGYEDMIDEAIEDEYQVNEQSFNPAQYNHQQQQQRQTG